METTTETNGADKKPSWAEVAAVSAEIEASKWTWETSEEVLEVTLTDGDMADLLRANGADEDAKAACDREIDGLKAELKEKKSESEAIAARMKDRNRAGWKGTTQKKAHWKVGQCFALNVVRYVDPITGVVVKERALTGAERQLDLLADGALAACKPTADAQLNLGDVEPSDLDATDLTDPAALLDAAQRGEDADDEDGEDLDEDESDL